MTILVLLGATEFQHQCENSFSTAKGLWFNRKTKQDFFLLRIIFYNTLKEYLEFLYQVAGMLKFNTDSHLKELSPFRNSLIL